MRKLSQVASGARVCGAALVLAMGCFSLAGCGGSGSTEGGAAASGATTEQEAPAEETVTERLERLRRENLERDLHWVQTKHSSSSTYEEESWLNPGEMASVAYSYSTEYELDENGDVVKRTTANKNEGEAYSSDSTTVKEYELDENGWPTKATKNETNVYTSQSFIEEEVVNEDGETEMVRRPDEEGPQTQEDEIPETTIEYSYEYDDEGRVTKATSSEGNEGTYEFAYHADGWIESYKHTYSYETYNSEGEPGTETYSDEVTLNELGVTLSDKTTQSSTDGSESVTTYEYDDRGRNVSTVSHQKKADGTEGEYTFTYENETDENGNTVSSTCTVSGDGNAEYRHYQAYSYNGGSKLETFDDDGKIHVVEVTYDENYNEVHGEEQVFDGPYSVAEYTYNELGDLVKSVVTYYDGTVETTEYEVREDDGQPSKVTYTGTDGVVRTTTYGYDENGNQTTLTAEEDGEQVESASNEYTYVENPSDCRQHHRYLWW